MLAGDADLGHDSDEANDGQNGEVSTEEGDAGKGKKRKKRKRKKTATNMISVQKPEHEDEDQLLEHLISESSSLTLTEDATQQNVKVPAFLRIERRHLNTETEKLVIMSKNSQLAHKLSQKMAKNRGHERRTGSGRLLVDCSNYARMLSTSLRMESDGKEGDITWFRLVHKPEYQKMQEQLLNVLQSPDPGKLIALLSLNPGHPELLLQMSHLVHREDQNMAAELIERAISCFESVFHPRFLLSPASSRMQYRFNENRPLFVAIFKHMCTLGHKGYNRTALEVCKLLWSFNPDGDPLAVLLVLDHYALSSNQSDFLLSLFESWREKERLDMLPNFRFSVALACFKKATSHKVQHQQLMLQADALIQDALLLFPQMLLILLDKCSVEPDASVLHSDFFNCAAEPKSLYQLLLLYAERSSVLWSKDRETIYWLERNVQTLISVIQQKGDIIARNREMVAKYYSNPIPRNVLRHIFLSDLKESCSCLPVDAADSCLYAFDPFPPANATASYEIRLKKDDRGGSSSILGLFLQSWMPAFNPETSAPDSSDDNRLKSSISSLMHAMSNLLTTANQYDDDV